MGTREGMTFAKATRISTFVDFDKKIAAFN